jgi:hypothetical protein
LIDPCPNVQVEAGRGFLASLAFAGFAPGQLQVGEAGDLGIEILVTFQSKCQKIAAIAAPRRRDDPGILALSNNVYDEE